MTNRKSILPWQPSGVGVPPSGAAMSSFGPPLLSASVEVEVEVEVESWPAEPVEELPPVELLGPGAVVTPGCVELEKPDASPLSPQPKITATDEAKKSVKDLTSPSVRKRAGGWKH